uniref:Uncharacterized protein n=1 Tax=Anopheles farauti TaxID=69004 RepID=A0A182QMS8_9DIPT
MFAAGPWYGDDDVCDLLPLITANDNSVIAKEVTFESGEFLVAAGEELPYVADFTLSEQDVDGGKRLPGALDISPSQEVALYQSMQRTV